MGFNSAFKGLRDYALTAQCIDMFDKELRINDDYFPVRLQKIFFYINGKQYTGRYELFLKVDCRLNSFFFQRLINTVPLIRF